MKKISFVIIAILISACTYGFDDSNVVTNSSKNNSIYITENEVFDIETPHFCYFFLSDCSSCEAIRGKIELYAMEHENFYMVEAPLSYRKGITKEESMGAKSVVDIMFVGFPTLVFIEDNTLVNMYVGISEITKILFYSTM